MACKFAIGSSRGDFAIQVGASGTDDLTNGVLMTSSRGKWAGPWRGFGNQLLHQCLELHGKWLFHSYGHCAQGAEYNINVSAAYFPYAKCLGGYARNSGGTNWRSQQSVDRFPRLGFGNAFRGQWRGRFHS